MKQVATNTSNLAVSVSHPVLQREPKLTPSLKSFDNLSLEPHGRWHVEHTLPSQGLKISFPYVSRTIIRVPPDPVHTRHSASLGNSTSHISYVLSSLTHAQPSSQTGLNRLRRTPDPHRRFVHLMKTCKAAQRTFGAFWLALTHMTIHAIWRTTNRASFTGQFPSPSFQNVTFLLVEGGMMSVFAGYARSPAGTVTT